MKTLRNWIVFTAIMFAGAFISTSNADDLQLAEKHKQAAQEISDIYTPTFDLMDHVLKTRLGYDHTGISDNDWRDLPALYKLETAYLAAERASEGGGEKMLAMLAKALAQDYAWMEESQVFKPFIEQPLEFGEKIRFAELSISDATKNRPQLTPEARALAAEISSLCNSGNKARSVLIDYFGLRPSEARAFVNERTLKDAFERAFENSANEAELDRKLASFVRDQDFESVGFKENKRFDPWRGIDPNGPSPLAPKPNSPPGGGSGLSWANRDSGLRSSGFKFFEPGPSEIQSPIAKHSSSDFNDTEAAKHQAMAKGDFDRLIADEKHGYKEKRVPRFDKATKDPKGLGGIILGNNIEDHVGKRPRTLKWVSSDGSVGELQIQCDDGEISLANVSREHAVVAYRLFFSGNQTTRVDPNKQAIGLLGVYDERLVDLSYTDRTQPQGTFVNISRLVTHPAISDLKISRDLAVCDTFPRSLELPFEESGWRVRMMAKLAELSNSDPTTFNDNVVIPLSMTNGWKISDVAMTMNIESNNRISVLPQSRYQLAIPDGLPQSMLTMFTFKLLDPNKVNNASANASLLEPIDGFETTHGLRLLPYLIATESSYKELNALVKTLAVARWAKQHQASMEEIKPEKIYEPIFGVAMHSDRIEFITRDTTDFELEEVVDLESYWNAALSLSVRPRSSTESWFPLKMQLRELEFLAGERTRSSAK